MIIIKKILRSTDQVLQNIKQKTYTPQRSQSVVLASSLSLQVPVKVSHCLRTAPRHTPEEQRSCSDSGFLSLHDEPSENGVELHSPVSGVQTPTE